MSTLVGKTPTADQSDADPLPHEFAVLRNLWAAVLRVWLQDAMKAHRAIHAGRSVGTDERHALNMIQRKERGFCFVCDTLNLDPEYVRSHVVEQDIRAVV